jgi:hypothetical protein
MQGGSCQNCEASWAAGAGGYVADVDELIESHEAELLNEDMMELETLKIVEQTDDEAGNEPAEEPRCFSIKEMALTFCGTV